MTHFWDVVVVGGGPAGLYAAARCAEAGLDTVIFEEHPRIGDPMHCTGIISLEIEDLMKIPGDIVLNQLTRARLVSPRGETCEFNWSPPHRETILVIDRSAFDRQLEAAARNAGVLIRTSARVDGLAPDTTGIAAIVDGEALRGRALVLACGVSYRFQRTLGLGLPGMLIHTAQLEVDAAAIADAVEVHAGPTVAPEGFAWIVPVHRQGRDRLKIGVMTRGDAGAYLQRFLAQGQIRARLDDGADRPIRRMLPLEPLRKTYTDRVVVVGDAGGFTKPTTGGGIFYSLLTASLAADTLIQGFHCGRLDRAFLSRYQARWRERLGGEIRVGALFRRCLMRATDADIDALVRALHVRTAQRMVLGAARFNWHREAVLALARYPPTAALLLRSLLR